ncbi:MAG: polyphosphate kinase [Chitinophagaceae bacterium]|nr:polyphosphate kinase [Chitinophagaceae bacterium]
MAAINLSQISTKADKDLDKKKTKEKTAKLIEDLNDLQNLLYAENKHSLLVIIQGMDASGKDGAIKNVFGHLNPQGVTVKSFKAPTDEELSRDFLWRIHQHAPAKGAIQIFNRSHYEDILITRVHKWCDDETAAKRMKAINDWEELLMQNNHTHIIKFYLHVSPGEQQQRLEERKTNPAKMWKYNENDYKERELWDDYMKMYEDAFANCNKPQWNIIPSDQNWYKEYLIAEKVYDTLKNLDMKFPEMKPKQSM